MWQEVEDPWEEEKEFIFIPAHPFNIKIFNSKYLNGLYIQS